MGIQGKLSALIGLVGRRTRPGSINYKRPTPEKCRPLT